MMNHPRASSEGILRQIFAGWPCIETYYDHESGQHVVRLAISDVYVASVAREGASALVRQLIPKTITPAKKFTGVRYHGRIVGRRGA